MNKVILLGRITRNPDTKQAGETVVTRFTLAVDRRFKSKDADADFISCVAFGKTAEFVGKYFKQGTKMALEGRIQTGNYTNKDGIKVYTTDVIAEAVEFAESKRADDAPSAPSAPSDYINVPEGIENDLPFK